MKVLWIVASVVAFLVVAGGLVWASPPGSHPSTPGVSAAVGAGIVVGPLTQAQTIPPEFWGINVEASHAFRSSDATTIGATPVTYLRFPGGNLGDRFNYTSGAIYNNSGVASQAATSVAQFATVCQAMHCHAILQLPAEINRPSTAAYYVSYVERTLGFLPDYWEIGNEPAGWVHYNVPWSNWGTTGGGNATPMGFADLVHSYIVAIRVVDPTTPLIALAAGQEPHYAKAWVSSVAAVDGPELAGISVHSYAAWAGPPSNPTLGGFFANLQGKWALPNILANDRQYIAANCQTCGSLKLFVDEINAAYGTGSYATITGSYNGTLFIAAEVTQALNGHADSLEWFCYLCHFPGAWELSSGQLESQYFLFESLLTHLAQAALPSTVSGPGGLYAAATTDGSRISILVVNTNVTTTAGLSLAQAGFATGSTLTEYLWPTGDALPLTRSIPSTAAPTLPPLSAAVLTGPATPPVLGHYLVNVTEIGLPAETSWSATLNGTVGRSTSSSISFTEPNGTYAFTVPGISGYSAEPASGSVTVNGGPSTVTVGFSGGTGSPPVTITSFTPSSPSISVGQTVSFATSVTGGTAPYRYGYSGLPAGCSATYSSWFVCTPTETGSFVVEVTVADEAGHSATASASLVVGPAPSVSPPNPSPGTSSGPSPGATFALVGLLGASVDVGVALAWWRRRRTRRYPPSASLRDRRRGLGSRDRRF